MDKKGCILLSELLFVLHIQSLSADCTFDSSLVGSWTSNDYEQITVTSSVLTLGSHAFNINGKTSSDWTCHDNSTGPYVILRSEVFVLYNADSVAFICMEATAVNNNSYYFYMNSPKNIFIGNERIHIFGVLNATGNATEICTETPSKAEFISMVRTGSEESALADCPDPLYRNFTYVFNNGGSDKCSSPDNGFVSVCPSRQELNFDYGKCASTIAYTSFGRLGCVASIFDDSSGTYYTSLYNFDDTVNQLITFRFTCAAVQNAASGDIQVTYTMGQCVDNQEYNTRPTSGGLITLTPNGTCEITTTSTSTTTSTTTTTTPTTTPEATTTETMTNTTESAAIDSNDSNIWPIVGAVLGGLLVISLLLIILYCLLRKKKVPDAKDDLVKVEDGLDGEESDDESIPSIEYPETWDTPTKDPIGPLRRYVTRDMMSQTELLKKLKNIAFREPEKPPTPPPPPPPPTPPPKTPPPKYMPWPWRTAKRASEKTMYQSEFPMKKFGPVSGSKQDNGNLADYTISKYGIKYDDTGIPISDKKLSRQATKFIPPSKSFVGMSTESSVISRSNSLPSLKESQSTQTRPPTRNSSHDESFYRSQSMEDIPATSTTELDSQVVSTIDPLSMQDIQIPTPSTTFNSFAPPKGTQLLLNIHKPVINTGVSSAALTKDIQTPALKRIQMYRALSTGSIGTFSDRTQTEILMEEEKRINETDGVNKTEIINDRDRPSIMDKTKQYIKKVPHYMFPIRSNSLTKFDKKMNKNPLSQTLPRSKTDMIPLSDKINRPKKNTLKKKKKKIKKTKNSPYLDSLTPRAQPPIVTLSQKKGYNNKVKPVDSNKKRKSKTNANFNTGSPSNKSTTTETDNTPEKYQPSPNLGMKSETFVRKQEDAELIPATTDFLHRMKSSATDFQDSGISADESSLDRQRSYCATKLPSITTHSEVGNNEQQKNDEQIKLPHLETKQKSYVRPWR